MAGTAEILQEYLVRVGFQTDAISLRKFDQGLTATGKKVLGVGTAVASMVLSMEAATAAFAYNMRKMYFASDLANSSVKNLKAMSYAGKQLGIESSTMAGAIKGMAQAMRMNPGLQGLVESFGIQVTGRDMSDVMIDYVKALKNMPEFVGAQYAGLFGIDPDTFHLMINNMDKLIEKKKESLELFKQMGVDPDKGRAVMLQYTETLDRLQARFSILSQAMMMKFLPQFSAVTQIVEESISYWTRWATGIDDVSMSLKDLIERLTLANISGFAKDIWDRIWGKGEYAAKDKGAASSISSAGTATAPASFAELEKKNGLPPGTLDKVWEKESGRGKHMTSKAGAQGHFQLMPGTAKELGVSNPNDLGQSSEAASRMLGRLSKKYGGDMSLALAAYNWGEGNVDSYLKTGKGAKGQALPEETQDYVMKLTGKDMRLGGSGATTTATINQQNTYNISGKDAAQIAASVERSQGRANADLYRQTAGMGG